MRSTEAQRLSRLRFGLSARVSRHITEIPERLVGVRPRMPDAPTCTSMPLVPAGPAMRRYTSPDTAGPASFTLTGCSALPFALVRGVNPCAASWAATSRR